MLGGAPLRGGGAPVGRGRCRSALMTSDRRTKALPFLTFSSRLLDPTPHPLPPRRVSLETDLTRYTLRISLRPALASLCCTGELRRGPAHTWSTDHAPPAGLLQAPHHHAVRSGPLRSRWSTRSAPVRSGPVQVVHALRSGPRRLRCHSLAII